LRPIRQRNQIGEAGPGAASVAERRQLTVMFADLVGSTELGHRLDLDRLAPT
jgi:class 3 adenylate cyclase